MNKHSWNSIMILFLVIADQAIKAVIEATKPHLSFWFFSINYVTNTGASFGMLKDSNTLLIFVSLMVLGIIMMNARQIKGKLEIPMLLIISGLLGNLIDRIFRGFVVDFIDLRWWPVFNLADSCIVIGVVWLCIVILTEPEKENQEAEYKKRKTK